MQDTIGIPACFSPSDNFADVPSMVTRPGQSVFMSIYRTKIADRCRLITAKWCKNLLLRRLSVSVEGEDGDIQCNCKVELKPWYVWRKQGSKHFVVDGKAVDVYWDLKAARFNGETEPISGYYVAVVCDEEVALLLGDLKEEAYRKTGCRPALIDPVLVSRKEHIFGKKKFATRIKFHERGRFHEISIEYKNRSGGSKNSASGFEPEMEIRIDGHMVIHVKHLQWKFRGNECININKARLEVYWDVHDWLFSPGLRHALFIFKPTMSSSTFLSSLSTSSSSSSSSSPLPALSSSTSTPLSSQIGSSGSSSIEGLNAGVSSEFCLFLYA